MDNIGEMISTFFERLMLGAPKFALSLIFLLVLHILLGLILTRFEHYLKSTLEKKAPGNNEIEKRINTLKKLVRKVAFIALWFMGALMLLKQVGVDIAPLLATAGVFGLAIGFGAKDLARDLIAGAFLLIENQIRVGDVALVNGTGGVVEDINVRTVVLRDGTGTLHVFPNGTISKLSNMTKDWSAFMLEMGVAYKEDLDHVMEVMKRVDAEMQSEEEWKAKCLEPMEMMGVDSFGDSSIVIKCRIKTKPILQWGVGREYRRRLKKAFDEEGIEIPFPHMSLYFGEASKAFDVAMAK
ncbi:mechanosensitive ion channel family protein [bacterium]|nr:mechanosensitive ion channel family protein [bacterium]